MKRIVFIIISLILVSCSLDAFLFNTEEFSEYTFPANTIQESLIEAVTFTSEGNTIYGFWVGSNGSRPGLTILYCHGNKHHIDEYWDRVMYLHELGGNVFIFDYRGYGKSEGKPSNEGMHADATAALNFIMQQKQVLADSLVIYGFSLGNVASIYLTATQITPYTLIAEAPFASINSLTQGSTVLDIPAFWLTEGNFDNAENIKKIECPLLLIHGEDDDFVRYRDNGKVVFQNAPTQKKLVLVPKAGHSDIPEVMGETAYLETLRKWLRNPG